MDRERYTRLRAARHPWAQQRQLGLFAAGTFTGGETVSSWPAAIGLALLAGVAILITRGRLAHAAPSPTESSTSRRLGRIA